MTKSYKVMCNRALLWIACSQILLHAQLPSGNDISSAVPIAPGQPIELTGDRSTRPHAVYAIRLEANQLFSVKVTRLPPWTSAGYDTVSRLSLYAPGIQSIQIFNPSLASAEVGDYAATGILNYDVAVSGLYYLDFQFFNPGISVRAEPAIQAATPGGSAVQLSGNDISSATAIAVGQTIFSIGDTVTKPHAVYSITLQANQLFSMKITRLGPWTSMGFETVARVDLYGPGVQSVQVFNPTLASADVGDYSSTAVLNYRVAVGGKYYLDFQFFRYGIPLQAEWISPLPPTSITSVNVAGAGPNIAQNAWIEIKGTGFAPTDIGTSGFTWSTAPEFSSGKMPTQLRGVSVKVNGKPAYVYYISSTQVNVLTPIDNTLGPVQVVLTNGVNTSGPFIATAAAASPAFFLLSTSRYIAATHANGTLLGPTSMSVPGYQFTSAQPMETVTLYATGFGLPSTALVDGSSSQSGRLPALPVIQIGGTASTVTFAAVVSPGLYQFNVVIPANVASGDNAVLATYGDFTTPAGALISVQR